MPSFFAAAAKALGHCAESLTWETKDLPITVAVSYEDNSPKEINLLDTIGFKVRSKPSDSKYWLQKEFSHNTAEFRKNTLAPMVARACLERGFTSIILRYNPKTNAASFGCNRGKYYCRNKRKKDNTLPAAPNPNKNRKYKKEKAHKSSGHTSNRPTKDDGPDCRCLFKFSIYWCPTRSRWYLPEKQAGCKEHRGHKPLPKKSLSVLSKTLLKEDKEQSDAMLVSRIKPTQVENYQNQKLGYSLTKSQYRYNLLQQKKEQRRKKREDFLQKVMLNPDISMIVGADDIVRSPEHLKSPADKLLHDLDTDEFSSYVAIYASYETTQLTIYQKSKELSNHEIVKVNPKDVADSTDSAELSARAIRNGLSITGTGLILLGIIWTDEDSARRFLMYPEIMSCDTTMKTNSEKRPLVLMAGKDAFNRTFSHTWGFLPSQGYWTFNWVFGTAFPALHGHAARKCVELVCTDQDGRLYEAIMNNCGPGRCLPKATHRLCAWHKFDRNFTEHAKYKSDISKLKTTDRIEFRTLHLWWWDLVKNIETEEELHLSKAMLEEYLADEDYLDKDGLASEEHRGSLGKDLKEKFLDYFQKSIEGLEQKYWGCYFTSMMTLRCCSSSHSEIENRALKYSVGGVASGMDIADTHVSISYLQQKKEREKQRKAARELTATVTAKKDLERLVRGVTKPCSDILRDEYEKRRDYRVCQKSRDSYYVKYCKETEPLPFADEDGITGDVRRLHRGRWIRPSFERTRTVSLVRDDREEDQQLQLFCSCGEWPVMGLACRHIYAVLDKEPCRTDAKVRWWLDFTCVGDSTSEDALKEEWLLLRTRSSLMVGVPLEEQPQLSHPTLESLGFEEKDFFLRSAGSAKLKERGFWATPRGQAALQRIKSRYPNIALAGPFNTTQDIVLSEHAPTRLQLCETAALENTQDWNGQYGFVPCPNNDEFDAIYVPPPEKELASFSQDLPDWSSEEEEDSFENQEIMKELNAVGAYGVFKDMFEQCTALVKTPNDFRILRDTLQQARCDLMKRAMDREGAATSDGKMASLPALDHGKKSAKRTKRMCSPNKKSKSRKFD